MAGGFGDGDLGMEEVENHFADRPLLANELARSWMTELKELIGIAAENDRTEPLREYVTHGRSWKFMTVIEHALRRGTADGEVEGEGGVFSYEIVDMLIALYQVCPTARLWICIRLGLLFLAGGRELRESRFAARNGSRFTQPTLFDSLTGAGHDEKCRHRDTERECFQHGTPPSPAALFRGQRPLAAGQVDLQEAEEDNGLGGGRRREWEKATAAEARKPEVSLFCDGENSRVFRLPQNLVHFGVAAEQPGMSDLIKMCISL